VVDPDGGIMTVEKHLEKFDPMRLDHLVHEERVETETPEGLFVSDADKSTGFTGYSFVH